METLDEIIESVNNGNRPTDEELDAMKRLALSQPCYDEHAPEFIAEIARLEARVKELEDWQARAVEKLHELQSTRTEGFVPSLAWKDTQELIKEAEGSEG